MIVVTGLEYEYAVARYLEHKGYTDVTVTQGSGDYGVDVLAYKDGCKYAVQCKYYTGSVSLDAVQEAVAGKAVYGCDVAMVVTNSTFTKAAHQLAQANGVILLDHVQGHVPSAPEGCRHFFQKLVNFLCKCYAVLALVILLLFWAVSTTAPVENPVEAWFSIILFVASPLLAWLSVKLLWKLICAGVRRLFASPAPQKPENPEKVEPVAVKPEEEKQPEDHKVVLPSGFANYLEDRRKNIESSYGLKAAISQRKPNLQKLVEDLNKLKNSDPRVYYNLYEAILAAIANYNLVKCGDLQRKMRQAYGLTSRIVKALQDLGLSVKCGELPLDPGLYDPEDDYLIISEQEFIDIIGIAEAEDAEAQKESV